MKYFASPNIAKHNPLAAFFLLLLLALSSGAFAQGDPGSSYQFIGDRFKERLQDYAWGDGTVAILIQDADYPLTAFAQNENESMQPAGLNQIVTAAAAFDQLGPEFRFTTHLGISGVIDKKVLQGNVVVRGDGDPTISSLFKKNPADANELFDRWAKLLRKQGIRKISGSVIGDDLAFDSRHHAPGWPLEHIGTPDLPSVSALNFNDNCVDIFWKYNKKPDRLAEFSSFPVLPKYVFFASSVKLEASGPERRYTRAIDSNVLSINGTLPLCTTPHDRASIEDPARFFAEAFKARLIERGIEVPGSAVAASKLKMSELPTQVKDLDQYLSPPLRQILTEMLQYDLPLHAEVVFKAMGQHAGARQGSFESGQDAVRNWLDSLHLPGSLWFFTDGSGRSRVDRISPAQLLDLMRIARRRNPAAQLDSLFPRAWAPGSLAERFRPAAESLKPIEPPKKKPWYKFSSAKPTAPKVAPQIWAKTGSADGVEALAGYVTTHAGRRLAFAFMVGGSRLPTPVLRGQMDNLILSLTE